jgi:hypothetical protein
MHKDPRRHERVRERGRKPEAEGGGRLLIGQAQEKRYRYDVNLDSGALRGRADLHLA